MTNHVTLTLTLVVKTLLLYLTVPPVAWVKCQRLQSCHLRQSTNVTGFVTEFWMYEESAMTSHPPSLMECAVRCLEDARCVTVMANTARGLCRLHAARVTQFNDLTPAEGFVSFDSCRAESSVIGDPCELTPPQTPSPCPLNHTECLDGICQCEVGYSFSPTLQACVTVCPKYGRDFAVFTDFYISRNNDLVLSDPQYTCPECCLLQCVNATQFVCRSLDLQVDKCMLSSVTAVDHPADYHFQPIFNITHYQRQCSYD